MKRVTFGYKGGFPLEQETLIHIQRAYADDMLEALLVQWGINPNQSYVLKTATSNNDGWIITTISREEVDAATGNPYTVTKPELIRLKFNNGGNRIEIIDLRLNDGSLNYADGVANKVYEEYVARLVATGGTLGVSELIPIRTILSLGSEVDDLKENYLPRDGSKPMTGGLVLGENKSTFTPGEEGNRLYFRGTHSNSDEVYISKNTPASDVTELRVMVGDNASGTSKDAFVVGGSIHGGSSWEEKFRVQTNGYIGVSVTNPAKILDVDAKNDFLRLRNLRQVNVNQEKPLVMNSQGDLGVASDSILTPQATETVQGKAEIATQTETNGSTDDQRFITPRKLHNRTATTSRRGIAEIATQTETNGSTDDERFITPRKLHNRTATTSRRGIAEIATTTETRAGTDNSKIVTPSALRNYMFSNLRVTYGRRRTTNRTQHGYDDFTKNYAYIYPPSGFTISNLRGFISSNMWIQFRGDVNGDDLLYCQHRVDYTNGRIIAIAQNSENRGDSWINYLAIWQK